MRYPWVNVALLVLLGVDALSGFFGLISGTSGLRWILWLHGIGGYAILGLARWKGSVVREAWRRRRRFTFPRFGFALLAGLFLADLATGLVWPFVGRLVILGYSLITIHVGLAIAIAALLAWHVLRMRFILRAPEALGRRGFLRLGVAAVAGFALWQGASAFAGHLDLPGARRRFTGSYELGSLSGIFPRVSWLFDDPPPVRPMEWRLVVDGLVERPVTLTYSELQSLAREALAATLDCTGGWFTTQEWQGIGLGRLLDLAGLKAGARSVRVEAVSGYGRRFALPEARRFLLATHVAGNPLDHGHGFPMRLVAPDHRGFEWVKWVARIQVDATSELLQSPVPLR
jgi:DMSO/TMAO reductase YedYZ molybdopterin-dependent catalytic subunit